MGLRKDALSFTSEFKYAEVNFMWLPDWLYERLPFLYVAASGISLWLLGASFVVTLSAVLLTGAAVLTCSRRHNARRLAAIRARHRESRQRSLG